MVLSLSNVDLHRRSSGFGSGLVQIRDGDERVGSLSAAPVVWQGGVAALHPNYSDGTRRNFPVCQGSIVAVLLRVVDGSGGRILGFEGSLADAQDVEWMLVGRYLGEDHVFGW